MVCVESTHWGNQYTAFINGSQPQQKSNNQQSLAVVICCAPPHVLPLDEAIISYSYKGGQHICRMMGATGQCELYHSSGTTIEGCRLYWPTYLYPLVCVLHHMGEKKLGRRGIGINSHACFDLSASLQLYLLIRKNLEAAPVDVHSKASTFYNSEY